LQVSPVVQALPSLQVPPVVGAQVPVTIAHVVQAPHAEPAFCQAPLESHSCGWAPLQVFAPGIQTPVQLPPLQTFAQAEPVSFQVPVASQI
jgi:hypothetical protein